MFDQLARFQAVGADVLDGRGTDRAGNQRQVFQTRPTLRQRPQHEVVPVLAGAGFDIPGIGILAQQAFAGNRHVQNQAVDIAGQDQVAAAAENEARLSGQRRIGQLGRVGHAQVACSAAGQGEGVERAQVDGGSEGHGGLFQSASSRAPSASGRAAARQPVRISPASRLP